MRIGRVGSVDPAPTSTRRQARSGEAGAIASQWPPARPTAPTETSAGVCPAEIVAATDATSLSSSIAAARRSTSCSNGDRPNSRTSRSIGVPSSSCGGNAASSLRETPSRSASSRVRIRLMSPTSDARPTSLSPGSLGSRSSSASAQVPGSTSTVMPAPRPTGSGRTPVDRPTDRPAGSPRRRPSGGPTWRPEARRRRRT